MEIDRRTALAGAALCGAAAALPRPLRGAPATAGGAVTPEMFGAKGDGVTNDSAAFAALADHVTARGGGTVALRRTTYLVGGQVRAPVDGRNWAFNPIRLMEFVRCARPLVIQGNGATIRCAPGLRFGTFDRRTDAPVHRTLPNYRFDELASPYSYMILADECSGPIEISDLELDGNLTRHRLGGPYGDSGWQIPGTGIFLRNNRGSEFLRNVHTHHHGQDGIMIDGIDDYGSGRTVVRRVENLRSEYNGRQGCSIVGGNSYVFTGCKFNHTGHAGLVSAPASGVDIEAEGDKRNRNHVFTDCEFVNNAGCGMVADSGDSDGARFTDCLFVGATNWSAWPRKPNIRFERCTFVGTVVNCYGDDDPRRAVQFHDCSFFDDPSLSPTGKVFLPGREPYGTIADVSSGTNALFNRCTFKLTHQGQLPWSWKAIYADCRMEQRVDQVAYPKGKYLGYSTIRGKVDMYGASIVGTLVVNGKTYRAVQL